MIVLAFELTFNFNNEELTDHIVLISFLVVRLSLELLEHELDELGS